MTTPPAAGCAPSPCDLQRPPLARAEAVAPPAPARVPAPPAAAVQAAEQARVSWGFIALYAAAHTGTWMAVMTPILFTLALRVTQLDPEGATSTVSLVLGISALLGVPASPFFGRLSDRTVSRLGMRRPWMVIGLGGGLVGLLVIALAPSIPVVLAGWCIAGLSFNALLAAQVAVLPDQVPEAQRGTVSGILGMCMPVGQIAGTYLAQAVSGSMLAMLLVPAAAGGVAILLFALVLRDRRLSRERRPPYSLGEFARSFWVNPVVHRDFAWAWANRFLWVLGAATLMTYQTFYLLNHLGYSQTEVPRLIFVSTLVQSSVFALSSPLGGRLSDLAGRRKAFVLAATATYGTGLWVIAAASSFEGFLTGMAIAGVGHGVSSAVGLALVTSVLPDEGTGAAGSLGVFNAANVMPQALAPAIAPAVLTVGGGSYPVLFGVAGAFAIAGALAIRPVRGVL